LNIKQCKKANAYSGGQANYIDERKYFMAPKIAEGSSKIMFKHLAEISYHKIKFLPEEISNV